MAEPNPLPASYNTLNTLVKALIIGAVISPPPVISSSSFSLTSLNITPPWI